MDLDAPTPGSLAWWIDERRIQLEMLWDEVAAAAGITKQTLITIRKGGRMRTSTKRKLEAVLKWDTGSIDAIAVDQPPTPLPAERPLEEIYNSETGIDADAAIRRLMELVPVIRANHGDERADELARFIMDTLRQDPKGDEDNGDDQNHQTN